MESKLSGMLEEAEKKINNYVSEIENRIQARLNLFNNKFEYVTEELKDYDNFME